MWSVIDRIDLVSRAVGLASCIGTSQPLLLADSSIATAEEILDRVERGHRVDFLTSAENGRGAVKNPVVGACRTEGRGVRIAFESGCIELTTGHVLPLGARVWHQYPSHEISEQAIVHAGHVVPGDVIGGHRVAHVTPLGRLRAVRLWTAHPAWISTGGGIPIGTRWHEIIHAWGIVEEQEEFPTVPVAHGYTWPRVHARVERFGRTTAIGRLGGAALVQDTLAKRVLQALTGRPFPWRGVRFHEHEPLAAPHVALLPPLIAGDERRGPVVLSEAA